MDRRDRVSLGSSRDRREIACPGGLHDGKGLPVLSFRCGDILVRDVDLLFEGVELRVLEYLPPRSANNGFLRLCNFPV